MPKLKKRLSESPMAHSKTLARKTSDRIKTKQKKTNNMADTIINRPLFEWHDFENKMMGRLVSVSQMQEEANRAKNIFIDDEEPKVYECAFCRASFKLSKDLISHNVKHLGEADARNELKPEINCVTEIKKIGTPKRNKIQLSKIKNGNKKDNLFSVSNSDGDDKYSLLEENLAMLLNSNPEANNVPEQKSDKGNIACREIIIKNEFKEVLTKETQELKGFEPVEVFTKSRRKIAKYSCKHCNKEFTCKDILHEHVYERVCFETPTKTRKRKIEKPMPQVNGETLPHIEAIEEPEPELKEDEIKTEFQISVEVSKTEEEEVEPIDKIKNDQEQLAKVLQEFSENCISPVKENELSSSEEKSRRKSKIKKRLDDDSLIIQKQIITKKVTKNAAMKPIDIKKEFKCDSKEMVKKPLKLNEESKEMNEDSKGTQKETKRTNKETKGTNKESKGINKEIKGINKEIKGINKDIKGVNKESKGTIKEPKVDDKIRNMPSEQFNNAFVEFLAANKVNVPSKENTVKQDKPQAKVDVKKSEVQKDKLAKPKLASTRKRFKNMDQTDDSFEKSDEESEFEEDFSQTDEEYIPEEGVDVSSKPQMSFRDKSQRKAPKRFFHEAGPRDSHIKELESTVIDPNIPMPYKVHKTPTKALSQSNIKPIENPISTGSKQCVLCPVKQSTDCQMAKHMLDFHDITEYHDCPLKTRCKELVSCTICGLVIASFMLKRHIADTHFSLLTLFSCPLCKSGPEFHVRKFLLLHLKRVHNIDNVLENNNAYVDLSSQKCSLCQSDFFTPCNMSIHNKHRRKHFIIRCPECIIEFPDSVTMTAHVDEKHRIKCGYCNEMFRTLIDVADHVFTVHPTSEFDNESAPEDNIPQEIKVEGLNNDRVILRGKGDTYVCKPCKRSFESRNATFRHFVLKHSNLIFCTQCDKKLYTHTEMLSHVKRFHGQNFVGFKCMMCVLNFGKLADKLVNHLRKVHEVPEAIIC